jgi:hypothetical protein
LTTKSAVFLPDHRERLPDEVHEADRSQIVIQQSETIQFPCVSFFGFFLSWQMISAFLPKRIERVAKKGKMTVSHLIVVKAIEAVITPPP